MIESPDRIVIELANPFITGSAVKGEYQGYDCQNFYKGKYRITFEKMKEGGR